MGLSSDEEMLMAESMRRIANERAQEARQKKVIKDAIRELREDSAPFYRSDEMKRDFAEFLKSRGN